MTGAPAPTALPPPSPSSAPTAAMGMGGRRASPAPVFLPDNDDLLLEILLRLPPLPSSLPRASLVCKRWRRLLSDPHFLRCFRAHHRKPPMLGFFFVDVDNDDGPIPVFTPTLATPDRIPPARFSFPNYPREGLFLRECRHGLALLFNWRKLEAVVGDPITGFRFRIAIPPEMKRNDQHRHCDLYNGAVTRNCCSGAFKVVTLFSNRLYKLAWACLYDSESGKWGNIISAAVPSSSHWLSLASWLEMQFAGCFISEAVVSFSLIQISRVDVIQMPEDIHVTDDSRLDLLRTADGGLGIAILSKQRIQLWGQTAVLERVVGWVLQKTIELDKLIPLTPLMETQHPTTIVGFDEDNNAIFLSTAIDTFMIQLANEVHYPSQR